MLDSLPVELSFVDADDRARRFIHENWERIFGRTRGMIGTAVQDWHPAKSVHVVHAILEDSKAGRRDVAGFWIEMGALFVQTRCFPGPDPGGAYPGTFGAVRDVAAIRALQVQKRLLDQTVVRDRPPGDRRSTDGQPAVRLRSIARCAGKSY